MDQSLMMDEPISVIHSTAIMSPKDGGVFTAVRGLTSALLANGVNNRVLMPYEEEAFQHQARWLPIRAESVGRVTFGPLQWSSEFRDRIVASDERVLHTHGIWLHPSIVALDWKRSKRLHVASVHGMLEPWAWQHRAWKKRPVWWAWERKNLQTADLLHATSHLEAEGLRNRGLTAPIAVIPNGVDFEDFPEEFRDAEKLDGKRTALFLSRVHPKKGLPLLIQAWNRIRPVGWKMRVVGPASGDHLGELQRMVADSGLAADWTFEPELQGDAKWEAYRNADLFILPTYSENFGIVVAEALGCGLPVITTHGAPWECLETENCGWWVPVEEQAIASALEVAVLLDRAELAEMGERGRAMARRDFGWNQIASDMTDCYRWILGCGGKPDCVF